MWETIPAWLQLVAAVLLFALGVRLSAFFSGEETGFYRLSYLKLGLEAQSGDPVAQRLLWFTQHPSHFVATTLVGNNVANFLAPLAIGMGAEALFGRSADWVEIAGTLLMTPVVFIFGELVPKNLYYHAPLRLMRRDVRWFVLCYRLFLVVSLPLVWVARILQRLAPPESRLGEPILGRKRLVQVLSEGHHEGILTEVQTNLAHGLLDLASEAVTDAMTPANRVLGVEADASREEILEFARRYGVTNVAVRQPETPDGWFGYLRVVDVAIRRAVAPARLVRRMPTIERSATKLEALLTLHQAEAMYGVVVENGRTLGTVHQRGLVEQMFRPETPLGPRPRPRRPVQRRLRRAESV